MTTAIVPFDRLVHVTLNDEAREDDYRLPRSALAYRPDGSVNVLLILPPDSATGWPLTDQPRDSLPDLVATFPQHRGWWAKADAVAAVHDLTPLTGSADQQTVDGLRATLDQERRDRQQWTERLTTDAHDYANREDWCDTFDRFMEDHGLAARARDFDVEVAVTYRVTVTVTASSEGQAEDVASEDYDAIAEAIRAGDMTDPQDIEVRNVETSQ